MPELRTLSDLVRIKTVLEKETLITPSFEVKVHPTLANDGMRAVAQLQAKSRATIENTMRRQSMMVVIRVMVDSANNEHDLVKVITAIRADKVKLDYLTECRRRIAANVSSCRPMSYLQDKAEQERQLRHTSVVSINIGENLLPEIDNEIARIQAEVAQLEEVRRNTINRVTIEVPDEIIEQLREMQLIF